MNHDRRRYAFAVMLTCLVPLFSQAQTKIDLSRQTYNADFTTFPSTKPVRTGTSLPSSCSPGEMYFKTDAAPGQNLYGCSTGSWMVLGAAVRTGTSLPGSCATGDIYFKTDSAPGQNLYACVAGAWSVVGSASDVDFLRVIDLKPSITATTLTIAAGRCWGAQKPTAIITITGGSGNGSFTAYCTDSQTIVVEHSVSAGLTVSCNNCVPLQLQTPAIPEGMYAIASGAIAGGQWSAVTDLRDFSMRIRHLNGTGMNVQCSGGTCVHQVDGAIVQLRTGSYTPLAQFDAVAATFTRPVRPGTALPGSCAAGELYFKTDAPAGQNLYGCTGGNWTVVGAPAVAVHTEWLPTGSCGNSDNAPRPDVTRWWEPRSGLSAAASSCSTSGIAPVKIMSRVFRSNAADSIMLVIPLVQNRTGNIDLTVHGYDTAGTGTFKITIEKACMTAGMGNDFSLVMSDSQTLQWTSSGTTTSARTLSGLTVPAGCSGHGLVLGLQRDVSVGGNSPGIYYLQGATVVQRSN